MFKKHILYIDIPKNHTTNFMNICPKCEPEGLAEQNYPVYIPGVNKSYHCLTFDLIFKCQNVET